MLALTFVFRVGIEDFRVPNKVGIHGIKVSFTGFALEFNIRIDR